MRHQDREKELQELSHAIVEALTHNDDVMTLLADLKEREVIDSSTLLGLALKISDLLELSGMAFTQEDIAEEPTAMIENKVAENDQSGDAETKRFTGDINGEIKDEEAIIDGRELSENEIAFQEWSNDNFDEKEWLKNTRLIW